MLEFGLEVYGGHDRTCVRACVVFSRGLEEALSLSLSPSEMVGFRDVGMCILGSWRREWNVPVCAVRYMVRRRAL